VTGTVNFHDQFHSGRQEIYNVPVNRNLAFECNSEPLACKLAPLELFRFCQIVPHEVSTLRKQRLEFEVMTRLSAHDDLQCPVHQLGFATHGATIHDARRAAIARTVGARREFCAA
jgi:hypothetical protein